MNRTYSELIMIPNYLDRFEYLKLDSQVGFENPEVTRWLNQYFYHTEEWRSIRNSIVVRDNGYDLGCADHPINGRVIVHHMNPITADDVINRTAVLFDPENLISVSHITHNAIHYGDSELLPKDLIERTPGDTCLWR